MPEEEVQQKEQQTTKKDKYLARTKRCSGFIVFALLCGTAIMLAVCLIEMIPMATYFNRQADPNTWLGPTFYIGIVVLYALLCAIAIVRLVSSFFDRTYKGAKAKMGLANVMIVAVFLLDIAVAIFTSFASSFPAGDLQPSFSYLSIYQFPSLVALIPFGVAFILMFVTIFFNKTPKEDEPEQAEDMTYQAA